ncbi:MAG: hypothetical protein GEV12_00890 [Micromonosporaceae bacterium]|nr:hypothetical protein [Micromonosporaceae bacterium]
MGDRNGKQGNVPDFEIVLWGYDRGQVERCLDDLTARLEEALCQLDSVEVLQTQLCDAQLEVDQLRRCAEERPSLANRLARLLQTAEELHARAQQDAAAIRAGGGVARSRNGSGSGAVGISAE